jgi:DNA helicase-2/ATP-dependent DNA helicase PcrA
MHKGLRQNAVSSVIAQRRDDFLSAEFRWLVASIKQIVRPLDIRNMAVLVEAFNRMSGVAIASDQIITGAEATGHSYFATWVNAMITENVQPPHDGLIQLISPLAIDPSKTKETVERIIDVFAIQISTLGGESDLAEDMAAWREISRDIGSHIGRNAPLDQFLQELQLRSKEPTPKPNTVTLMTIHGAKGREFDSVYVIGLVEDVMPSYQSKQKGEHSAEMEEERRNCFVAITRAKECLVLSRAGYYRGWQKQPSRFLVEMGLVHERVEEEG